MKLSVLLCTHNPRADHLAQTLAALEKQTLPAGGWELIVVDNASAPPVRLPPMDGTALRPRLVLEPELGLTAARLRGLAAATGTLLVFVDDDNVLAPDYLERACELAQRWPALGAFGGQIHPRCEVAPTPWFAARLDRLAIREFSTETRSQHLDLATVPCGAGLCVHAEVAALFCQRARDQSGRLVRGNVGAALSSGDDLEFALAAEALGREIGRFPSLELTHLIPAGRLTLRYFARITRAHALGARRLRARRGAGGAMSPSALAALAAHWKWSVIDTALSLLPAKENSDEDRRDRHPRS